jgi:hypothetical protein
MGKNPDIDNVHVYPPYKAQKGAKIPSGKYFYRWGS